MVLLVPAWRTNVAIYSEKMCWRRTSFGFSYYFDIKYIWQFRRLIKHGQRNHDVTCIYDINHHQWYFFLRFKRVGRMSLHALQINILTSLEFRNFKSPNSLPSSYCPSALRWFHFIPDHNGLMKVIYTFYKKKYHFLKNAKLVGLLSQSCSRV